MKASGSDLRHNPPAGRASKVEKLVHGLAQLWEEPSVQRKAGEGLDSLDASILRAPNCPHEAAGTLNLLLITAAIVIGTLLFMGYWARQCIIYMTSPYLISVQ